MQLLVLILNKLDCLDSILKEFVESGIKGATILDSVGMARALTQGDNEDIPMFGFLKTVLHESRPFNKTILVVVKDEQVSTGINAIKRVLGDLTEPDTGIVFTVPIGYVEGIIK